MRPVTDRFLQAVRGSHAMRSRVRVVAPGLTGTNPGGTEIPVESGDVKLDVSAEIRSSLDLTTLYDWPADATGLLTPYGNELFVERGVVFGSTVEWVSLGYFRMYSVDQDAAPDGPIQISALDRMSGIVDAIMEAPREYDAGATVETVFNELVQEVYPAAVIQFDFSASTTTFAVSHIVDEDRYQFLKDIVDSLGKVMFWDYQGRLQVKTAPDPTVSVFDVNHGKDGVLVEMARSLDREGVRNAVIVTGEAAGEEPPVRGTAHDVNPMSPTNYFGPFGKVPEKITSSFVSTPDQARVAAEAKLARMIGLPHSVEFKMVPNCALEPLDPIWISYSGKHTGEMHVIDTLTVPLEAEGVMTGTTRKQIPGGAG